MSTKRAPLDVRKRPCPHCRQNTVVDLFVRLQDGTYVQTGGTTCINRGCGDLPWLRRYLPRSVPA